MAGHRDRPDDAGETGRLSRPRPYSSADLRARLEQLPESHPSSPRYRGRSSGPADRPGDERGRSGWDSPGVAGHPDKPSRDAIRLTDDRRRHILEGDEQGGGHRHGTGRPRKTEFPATWDDDKIIRAILETTRDPRDQPLHQSWNGRWRVRGTHEGVEIVSIVESDGRVWSGWPLDGSPGVVKNPKKGA